MEVALFLQVILNVRGSMPTIRVLDGQEKVRVDALLCFRRTAHKGCSFREVLWSRNITVVLSDYVKKKDIACCERCA